MWLGHYSTSLLLGAVAASVADDASGRSLAAVGPGSPRHRLDRLDRGMAAGGPRPPPGAPVRAVHCGIPARPAGSGRPGGGASCGCITLGHRRSPLLRCYRRLGLRSARPVPPPAAWVLAVDALTVAALGATYVVTWQHRRLYPWCPFCRWDEGGEPRGIPGRPVTGGGPLMPPKPTIPWPGAAGPRPPQPAPPRPPARRPREEQNPAIGSEGTRSCRSGLFPYGIWYALAAWAAVVAAQQGVTGDIAGATLDGVIAAVIAIAALRSQVRWSRSSEKVLRGRVDPPGRRAVPVRRGGMAAPGRAPAVHRRQEAHRGPAGPDADDPRRGTAAGRRRRTRERRREGGRDVHHLPGASGDRPGDAENRRGHRPGHGGRR